MDGCIDGYEWIDAKVEGDIELQLDGLYSKVLQI